MRSDDAGQAVVPRQHSFVRMDGEGELALPVGTDCGPGQTVVPLNSSNAEGCKNNPWDPAEESDPSADPPAEVRLNEIEKILMAAESAPIFEVVDRDGRSIFQVLPCEMAMSNTAEERVITLNASDTGGYLTATNQAIETIPLVRPRRPAVSSSRKTVGASSNTDSNHEETSRCSFPVRTGLPRRSASGSPAPAPCTRILTRTNPATSRSFGRPHDPNACSKRTPEITQAGEKNYVKTSTKVGFEHHPGAWPDGVRYYAHAIGR
jgi:hypothetical protein